jgi:hypothetical protein
MEDSLYHSGWVSSADSPSRSSPLLFMAAYDDAHSKYGEISAIDVRVEGEDDDDHDHQDKKQTKTKLEVVSRSSSMMRYSDPSFRFPASVATTNTTTTTTSSDPEEESSQSSHPFYFQPISVTPEKQDPPADSRSIPSDDDEEEGEFQSSQRGEDARYVPPMTVTVTPPPLDRAEPPSLDISVSHNHRNQKYPSLQQRLSWRMDPSQSLSDCQLQIFNRSTKVFHTYHVHRVVLAVGSRACGYFQKAFSAASKKRHSNSSTTTSNSNSNSIIRVPLISQACRVVPHLLDYLYDLPTFPLNTDTAVGLAYLAEYVQQPTLLQRTLAFVDQDLHRDTLHRYWIDAIYYDQQDILDWVVTVGARELPFVDVHSSGVAAFLADLAPAYLVQMLDLVTVGADDDDSSALVLSSNLCTVVVEYCVSHRTEVTLELLEQLTTRLPLLTPTAAMAILELELAITEDDDDHEEPCVSPLQQRCLEVLSQDWGMLGDMDPSIMTRLLHNMSTHDDLHDWFPQTLQRAHEQLCQTQDDLTACLDREAALRKELEHALEVAKQSQQQAWTIRKTLTSAKVEMKGQVAGWIKKHAIEHSERLADQEKWEQERALWRMERQEWFEERSESARELFHAKKELERLVVTGRNHKHPNPSKDRRKPCQARLDASTCSHTSEESVDFTDARTSDNNLDRIEKFFFG